MEAFSREQSFFLLLPESTTMGFVPSYNSHSNKSLKQNPYIILFRQKVKGLVSHHKQVGRAIGGSG
jgi:hypothetical protein